MLCSQRDAIAECFDARSPAESLAWFQSLMARRVDGYFCREAPAGMFASLRRGTCRCLSGVAGVTRISTPLERLTPAEGTKATSKRKGGDRHGLWKQ